MADAAAERRQFRRAPIALRAHVKGWDPDGTAWEEYATTIDVSIRGAFLPLKHPVDRGQILLAMLPMPAQYRRYDPGGPLYRVYALVRRRQVTPEGGQVGLRFLGKDPPRGFEKHPACRYLLPGDPPDAAAVPLRPLAATGEDADGPATEEGRERRHGRRLAVFLDIRIHRLNVGAESERTVAENLGKGGARILTALPIQAGETIRLEEVDGAFSTRAKVVHTYLGTDRALRLNLRFLDAELPKRLLPDLPD